MILKRQVFSVLCLVSVAWAFKVKEASVSFGPGGSETVRLPETAQGLQRLSEPIRVGSSAEVVDFSVSVSGSRLDQATLLLGVLDRGLEIALSPAVSSGEDGVTYRFEIAASNLPKAFLQYACSGKDLLTASVILANRDSEDNVFEQVFNVRIEYPFSEEWREPTRFSAKPEIFHEFQGSPKMISGVAAAVGCVAVVLVPLVMLYGWSTKLQVKFEQQKMVTRVVFLVFIAAVELVFVNYSIGMSIFKALEYTLYAALPALYFGSKAL